MARTIAELAAALRDASARGRPVVPWGAGTLQHLGRPPAPEALALRTTALSRIVEYNPADLTITVEAGVSLGAIQDALRPHGQWLPWDPPAPDDATIGGLLAAGASGPLRLGYGTPRDWALGMRVALGDGRLVKSGGKVVKNVAGYETHKLHVGALGTLGVIAEVTLKVAPLPERIRSLVLACRSREDALALAERLREPPLAPVSLALSNSAADQQGRWLVAARFSGAAAAVERQLGIAVAQASGATTVAQSAEQSQAFWQKLARFSRPDTLPSPAHGSGAGGEALIIRAGTRPAALPHLLESLERHAPAETTTRVAGYGGVGLAYARWYLTAARYDSAITAIAELRAALAAVGGYAVVEDAPAELRVQIDLWGPPPPALALMRALKAQWDPRGVLNRGRYIV
ncbi:MAG TPA: FAD-binding oxidoreductase [Roseiflexaceae bacterium]